MKNTKLWTLVIGILLIVAVSAYFLVAAVSKMVQDVSAAADRVTQPIDDVAAMTSGLATQMAQALNPTPTILPDPVTIIHEVRSLARLETIEYTVEKVIQADSGQQELWGLLGDKLIFVAHGNVIAGVDLAKLLSDDLWVDTGTLYVRLPETEIFVATLDNDKSYVYDRDTGLFTKGNIDLETLARQAAEDEIKKAALEDGILEQARTNAEYYLLRLFQTLGYPQVIFVNE
ncbi:MAG TPA: DUF4230 domain-containing protein [Anaerolineales bacterium]|nr:DUF4230 domain-containing protein [Anaerolineales bacterium]